MLALLRLTRLALQLVCRRCSRRRQRLLIHRFSRQRRAWRLQLVHLLFLRVCRGYHAQQLQLNLLRRRCLRLRRAAVFLQRHMRIELRSSAAVTSTASAILANSA